MPRLRRAPCCLVALVCAACEVASAPSVGSTGPAAAAPPFEVGIDGVYLTQSVQDYAGTVPLVQGRAGLLRIFLRSRRTGVPAPVVRIHVVDTATDEPIQSYTAQSPLPEVPTYIVEGALGGSWNVSVPGADVQPGRHIVAEMDAVPGVPESQLRLSFRYPAQGSLDVHPARHLGVTLVPIVQSGLQPEVVTATRTADSWIDRARWIHPLGGVDVDVESAYTSAFQLGFDGSGWADVVAELDRKRVAEGSSRSYLGIVKVSYRSGTVGRGDVGGKTAVAWDAAASYQRVAAHELGHNFGLRHAPCGIADPSSVDPNWPTAAAYAGARIGMFGWDPVSGVLKDPGTTWDHMSYCGDASTTWASDYGYRAAMGFLDAEPAQVAAASRPSLALEQQPAPRQRCLLVSGRLRGDEIALDPAYVVETRPSRLTDGEYVLELLGAGGAVLGAIPFAPARLAHEDGGDPGDGHFAMAIPLPSTTGAALAGLAVRRGGVEVVRRVAGPSAAAGDAAIPLELKRGPRHAALRWDGARHPEVMIRDPRTGEVLGFARGGAALLHTDAPELELVLSDGVRSGPALRARAR
jgi:reprolysin-like metallo-peptidase family M12B